MANGNRTSRITPAEVFALADRLTAYANLPMFQAHADMRRDVRLAAKLIRHTLENGIITAPIELN